MEKIMHSGIEIDIEKILNIAGLPGDCEILVRTRDKEQYKIVFDFVLDLRCFFKEDQAERLSKMQRNDRVKSSVITIDNSEYLRYTEEESYGTIMVADLTDYMISDDTGYVVELLQKTNYNPEYPKLIKGSSAMSEIVADDEKEGVSK